jgi:hypothetical protein
MPAMDVRIARRGPAGKYEMWARCRDVGRWPTWMALVRGVEAAGPLRAGLEGDLLLPVGVRVRFDVLEVREQGPSWTLALRVGPIELLVEHHIDDGFGLAEVTGPLPLPLAVVPFVRRSLSSLLRRGRQSPPVV